MDLWKKIRDFGDKRWGGNPLLPVTKETTYEERHGIGYVKRPTREKAMQFVPFARCINIISTGGAGLICNTVKVVNRDNGELAKTPRANAALRLLKRSPDGVQSGFDFIRDILGDYLIDGNAVIHVSKSKGMTYDVPIGLTRLDASGSYTRMATDGNMASVVYWSVPDGSSTQSSYSIKDIAHAKFAPRSIATHRGDGRGLFAQSCLKNLARPISIGMRTDGWVDEFFDDAPKNDMAITIPQEAGKKGEERIIESWENHVMDKRSPLYLHGGSTAQVLAPNPQNADAKALREYGAVEIGRYYGVPSVLLMVNFTSWGSGIEQLARMYYRYGVRQHIEPLLDSLSFKLLPENLMFEIDPTQEVKGDMAAMTSFVSAMRPTTNNPAVMSLKEVRDVIGARGELEDDWNWEPGTGAPGNSMLQLRDDAKNGG